MKALTFALALVLPMVVSAEEKNVLAGRYAGCAVDLQSLKGIPASKWYVFTFGEDSSLAIEVKSYPGTEKCEGSLSGTYEYKSFHVIDDSGNHPGRFITAQDLRTKQYFKFNIAKSYAAIYSGETYPVKGDFIEMMLVYREP